MTASQTTLEENQPVTDIIQNKNMEHNYRIMSEDELNKLLEDSSVSKNQKKKIRKQIEWLNSADKRKEERKKRKLLQKERSAAKGIKRKKFDKKISTKENFDKLYHIVVDASFDHLMLNKDIKKLGKQISWCYKVNRRSPQPIQYHICGMKERLSSSLDPSYPNWDLHFDEKVMDAFPKDSIIYLTAESPNIMKEMLPGIVYVIGGLVDHNHQKGLCHRMAEENGIATARLPLEEHFDFKTRKVLTVNHVFEILLAFRECADWKESIQRVLPAKKISSEAKNVAEQDNKDRWN